MKQRLKNYHGAIGYDQISTMLDIYAHEALCLICCKGGCPLNARYEDMLEKLKKDPMHPVRLNADLDVACLDGRSDPKTAAAFDYVNTWRDLEVLRRLGLSAGSIRPAYYIFNEIFKEFKTVESVCGKGQYPSKKWPACEHCYKKYFENVLNGPDAYSSGVYKILELPRREDLVEAKTVSSQAVKSADHIYIRPAHLMCLICVYGRKNADEEMWQDNLVELRKKIQAKPNIPVTLCLGTNCDVCGPCPVFDRKRNLCFGHEKSQIKDYMILRLLEYMPYETVEANKLFGRLFERIETAKQICGWQDLRETSPDWRKCPDTLSGNYECGREKGLF